MREQRRRNNVRKKTVISALFLDFDGTISPIGVSREEAQPSPQVRQALDKIAQAIPVAVVTMKDMRFIQERVPFAWAWAAICGVEIKIGDKVLSVPQIGHVSSIETILESIETKAREIDRIYVERKALSDGRVAAFCIDWRLTKDWDTARRRVNALLEPFEKEGLAVLRYADRPYVDIYQESVDKGKAFLKLKRELKAKGAIMYLVDSELDNPAFKLADVSIGILHHETPSKLDCKFFVRFGDIEAFFRELWHNHLTFDSESQWIVRNERS